MLKIHNQFRQMCHPPPPSESNGHHLSRKKFECAGEGIIKTKTVTFNFLRVYTGFRRIERSPTKACAQCNEMFLISHCLLTFLKIDPKM